MAKWAIVLLIALPLSVIAFATALILRSAQTTSDNKPPLPTPAKVATISILPTTAPTTMPDLLVEENARLRRVLADSELTAASLMSKIQTLQSDLKKANQSLTRAGAEQTDLEKEIVELKSAGAAPGADELKKFADSLGAEVEKVEKKDWITNPTGMKTEIEVKVMSFDLERTSSVTHPTEAMVSLRISYFSKDSSLIISRSVIMTAKASKGPGGWTALSCTQKVQSYLTVPDLDNTHEHPGDEQGLGAAWLQKVIDSIGH